MDRLGGLRLASWNFVILAYQLASLATYKLLTLQKTTKNGQKLQRLCSLRYVYAFFGFLQVNFIKKSKHCGGRTRARLPMYPERGWSHHQSISGGGGVGSSHVHAYTFDTIVVVEANLSDRDFTDIAAPFAMKSLLRCTVTYVNGSYDLIQIALIGQDLQ